MAILRLLAILRRRPCCPEDVPMSRGRPHRRFHRPLEDAGPESTRGPCHVPRERCVQPRALANTLLREPLNNPPERVNLCLSPSFSFPESLSLASLLLPSPRPGYQISCSSSDVHGSRSPRYSSDRDSVWTAAVRMQLGFALKTIWCTLEKLSLAYLFRSTKKLDCTLEQFYSCDRNHRYTVIKTTASNATFLT